MGRIVCLRPVTARVRWSMGRWGLAATSTRSLPTDSSEISERAERAAWRTAGSLAWRSLGRKRATALAGGGFGLVVEEMDGLDLGIGFVFWAGVPEPGGDVA